MSTEAQEAARTTHEWAPHSWGTHDYYAVYNNGGSGRQLLGFVHERIHPAAPTEFMARFVHRNALTMDKDFATMAEAKAYVESIIALEDL